MYEEKLQTLMLRFPARQKRSVERSINSIMKNASSNWLSIMPLVKDHFDLSPQEFRDALAIRYHKESLALPKSFDGCGKNEFNDST